MYEYLGIDYGSKRIGIAVSNAEGTIAFPRGMFLNDKNLMTDLAQMAEDENIEAIVVGDTRSPRRNENPVTAEAEKFMEGLAQRNGLARFARIRSFLFHRSVAVCARKDKSTTIPPPPRSSCSDFWI